MKSQESYCSDRSATESRSRHEGTEEDKVNHEMLGVVIDVRSSTVSCNATMTSTAGTWVRTTGPVN